MYLQVLWWKLQKKSGDVMPKIVFSQDIQKKYLIMHNLVVKTKFYFLKAIQSISLSDDDKNNLREQIIEISTNVNRHFTTIRYAKITPYNKDEYELNEITFIRETQHYLELLIRGCVK
jgi:hypothetical protein